MLSSGSSRVSSLQFNSDQYAVTIKSSEPEPPRTRTQASSYTIYPTSSQISFFLLSLQGQRKREPSPPSLDGGGEEKSQRGPRVVALLGELLGTSSFLKDASLLKLLKNQKENHAFNLPPLNRVRGSPSLKIKRWQFATASFLIFIEVSRSHCAALQGKQEGNNPRKQGTSTGCNPTNKQPLGSRLSPRVA
jgi:hypothetical protein